MKNILRYIGCSRWNPRCICIAVVLYLIFLYRKKEVYETYGKSLARVQPEWVQNAEKIDSVDEGVLRCAVQNMGCFNLLPTAIATKVNKNFTLELCLDMCFKRNTAFAALRGTKCYCSTSMDKLFATRLCDVSCSADKSKNCTSAESVVVHRKTKGCIKGADESSLEGDKLGCSSLPGNITGAMSVWNSPLMTISQCVLKCERHKFALAMPLLRFHSCLCSDLLSMFGSVENMQQTVGPCSGVLTPASREEKVPLYKTFVDECGPKRFLKRKEGPYTILTSFWGSGNTWLRHLIEIATGIYTGSVYMDEHLYTGGMIGEKLHFLSGRTIVIKDHIMSKPEAVSKKYTSAILILRNPYDATLAEFARARSHNNHTALLDPKIYESTGFKTSVKSLPEKWIFHAKMLFNLISPVMVVYYEDLLRNPVRELRRIISFLPSNVVPHGGVELERRLMCMKLDLTGNFKRGSKGLRLNPFDAELQEVYGKTIRRMNDLLTSKNKTGLPSSYFQQWHL